MPTSLAQDLLAAQISYHLDRLSADSLTQTLQELTDDLFAAAGNHQIADLIDADALTLVVKRSLKTVPASAGVGGLVDMTIGVVRQGPRKKVALGDVVRRDQVEATLDAVLALVPTLEKALDKLTDSPMVGTVATRFMGRVAGEVIATNQAIADKIPGLGSLTRLGTSAASKVVGVADKQLEGLMNATVGKGSTFAVRRLNRILLDTAQDPATRDAVLQVWDLLASEPLAGLDRHLDEEQITGLSEAGYDLAVTVLGHQAAGDLAGSLVAAFLEWFGGYTPTELLDQLQITREDLDTDLKRIAPRILALLRQSGDLERIVRAQLEPFYSSPEVAELLKNR